MPADATIPIISPEEAYERAKGSSGCTTVETKVTKPGVSVGRDCVRITATTDTLYEAVSGQAMTRLDTNGAWKVDRARETIPTMAVAAGVVPIEYVE